MQCIVYSDVNYLPLHQYYNTTKMDEIYVRSQPYQPK